MRFYCAMDITLVQTIPRNGRVRINSRVESCIRETTKIPTKDSWTRSPSLLESETRERTWQWNKVESHVKLIYLLDAAPGSFSRLASMEHHLISPWIDVFFATYESICRQSYSATLCKKCLISVSITRIMDWSRITQSYRKFQNKTRLNQQQKIILPNLDNIQPSTKNFQIE